MIDRFVSLGILAILIAAGWFGFRYVEREYPQHLSWTPLVLDQPVGLATKAKLAALTGDKQACLALFDASDLAIAAIDERRATPECGIADAVTLQQMTAAYSPSTVQLTCPLAAALAIWETDVVQPAAREILGSAVTRIDQLGTYSCRRIAGSQRWSRHAEGAAIDVAGFGLADGRQITLAGDWGRDSDTGRFLARVRDGGCGVFGTILGPDYNAAHRDHFHMQATGFGTCR